MKKRSFKIIALTLIAALLCSPLFAYATVREGECEVPLLQEGDYEILEAPVIKHNALQSTSAEEFLYQEMLKHTASINMSSYSLSVDNISAFYSNVVNDHPDLFFISSTVAYNYYPSTNCVAYIRPQYVLNESDTESALNEFEEGANKALSHINSSMTDEQKAIILHDYICNLAMYPTLKNTDDADYSEEYADLEIYHSAYGFFHNYRVVCAGFTLAYTYLLDRVGIESEYVASDKMRHAWNKLKIDGNWYNADLTYDNFDNSTNVNTYGAVRHQYFLKSDEYFCGDGGSYHFGGVTYDDCPATSTDYDNAFWNNVNTMIYAIDGNYYYLKQNASSSSSVSLTKRDSVGAESQVGTVFYASYLTYSYKHPDESGTLHSGSFVDTLCRLAYLDNRFYVFNHKTVYSVLFDGTKHTIVELSSYANGFGVNDNNNLIYQLYQQSEVNELDKKQYFRDYQTLYDSEYNNYPDINLDGYINAKDYAYIIKS